MLIEEMSYGRSCCRKASYHVHILGAEFIVNSTEAYPPGKSTEAFASF